LMTRETVWAETPACFATCLIVILRLWYSYVSAPVTVNIAIYEGFVNLLSQNYLPKSVMHD
jgi:hypothetical protein